MRISTALPALIERLARRIEALEKTSRRFSQVRLGIVLATALIGWLAFRQGAGPGWGVVLAGLALFILVARRHGRVLRSIKKHRLYRTLQQQHVARATLDWPGLPAPLDLVPATTHPFAADFNLTGPRSLHQLLDTAATHGGSARLRDWLLQEIPDPADTLRRQTLVRELRPLKRFRDRLALAAALVTRDTDERWDGEGLLKWLDKHGTGTSLRPFVIVLALLGPVNVTVFILWVVGLIGPWWLLTAAVYGFLYVARYAQWRELFEEASHLETALYRFEALARVLEAHPIPQAPEVATLLRPFRAENDRPSRRMRRVAWLAGAAGISQKNELLWLVLNLVFPWDIFWTDRLHEIKKHLRKDLPVWLDVSYELEALGSLATSGWLHPERPFPTLHTDASPRPLFSGKEIGHPLIPMHQKVRNDFTAAAPGDLLLITGSNMSGKSTFLRTLGVNLVLAQAGAPVDAAALEAVPLRLFSCMGVADSVHDGISFFYAEVRRLRALLDALHADHPYPLFFLIDEIFRGTNNRERLIGSRAFIRELVDEHGTGCIATHDLELTALADELPGVQNAHFRETVEGNEMVFDYCLRPGPCPTTNALRIMELAGLPVERP